MTSALDVSSVTAVRQGVWQCFAVWNACGAPGFRESTSGESCIRKEWHPPKFGEHFAGPHAPLTHAVAQVGGIEVQRPFDLLTGDDIDFTEVGRKTLRGYVRILGSIVSTGHQSADCSPERAEDQSA